MTTNATTPDSQSLGENGHTSQDDHSKETKVVSAAPDGGLQAWLVAAGAGCVFFSCLGFANSFGSFAQFYITHQLSDRSEDDIAWIGSLSATLQFVTGLIGGPLFDRYGTRVSQAQHSSLYWVTNTPVLKWNRSFGLRALYICFQ